jgi:hypothetical protein
MHELRSGMRSGTVDDGLGQHSEPGELLADPLESELELVPLVPDLHERLLEDLHPAAPVVPLLNAEERRVDVDHRSATVTPKNQGFARGETRGPGPRGR